MSAAKKTAASFLWTFGFFLQRTTTWQCIATRVKITQEHEREQPQQDKALRASIVSRRQGHSKAGSEAVAWANIKTKESATAKITATGTTVAEAVLHGNDWPNTARLTMIGVTANVQSRSDYKEQVWSTLAHGQTLDESDASVALICLQEAPGWNSDMPSFLENATTASAWKLLGHYANHGMTSMRDRNHQALSVLVRPPKDSGYIWLGSQVNKDAGRHCLSYAHPSIKGSTANLCTMLSKHRTSVTGKGGALALIDFENGFEDELGRRTLAFRLAASCVHLDANTDKSRDQHTNNIIAGLGKLNRGFRQAVVAHEKPGVDGWVFMGDLNYRFRQSVLGGLNRMEIVNLILQHLRGMPSLMTADPLGAIDFRARNPNERISTRGAAVQRFNLTCNTPKFQPPTYKLMNASACRMFLDCIEDFRALSKGKQRKIPPVSGGKCQSKDIAVDMFDLAAMCYSGLSLAEMMNDKSMMSSWAKMKGGSDDKLQLGWLDRVCWRTTNRRESISFHVEEDMEFAKNKWHDASVAMTDHLPTLSKFSVTWKPRPFSKRLVDERGEPIDWAIVENPAQDRAKHA